MKKKNLFFSAVSMLLTALSVIAGGGMMAVGAVSGTEAAPGAAGANENGGTISQGVSTVETPGNLKGVASQTDNANVYNEAEGEGYDSRGLERTIRELQPMKTPFDQMTRYASNGEKPAGMKFEYSSIGSRPIESVTTSEVAAMGSGATTVVLPIKDPQAFSVDDVILCPEIAAITNADGVAYSTLFESFGVQGGWPCLQLKICGYDSTSGTPVVYAINGNKRAGMGNIGTPVIPDKTKIVRIAKAVNEAKSETGRTNEAPNDTVQFCQIFMAQTEETLIHKLTKRDVNGLDLAWNERRTLEDFRMAQAGTFLFGDRALVTGHPCEEGNKCWYTGGAWWQAKNDYIFGHMVDGNLVINEDDLVELNGKLFTGEGSGGVKKLLFAGSEFVTALEKIKSEKFRLKGDVQAWDLTFTSWKTTLGELLVVHDEMLDRYGKADQAFVLDPEYFEKRVLLSLDRAVRDMDAAGIRATTAVRLKEVSAVVLYSPNAHARLSLAKV
jgi:hypothetical protein